MVLQKISLQTQISHWKNNRHRSEIDSCKHEFVVLEHTRTDFNGGYEMKKSINVHFAKVPKM